MFKTVLSFLSGAAFAVIFLHRTPEFTAPIDDEKPSHLCGTDAKSAEVHAPETVQQSVNTESKEEPQTSGDVAMAPPIIQYSDNTAEGELEVRHSSHNSPIAARQPSSVNAIFQTETKKVKAETKIADGVIEIDPTVDPSVNFFKTEDEHRLIEEYRKNLKLEAENDITSKYYLSDEAIQFLGTELKEVDRRRLLQLLSDRRQVIDKDIPNEKLDQGLFVAFKYNVGTEFIEQYLGKEAASLPVIQNLITSIAQIKEAKSNSL